MREAYWQDYEECRLETEMLTAAFFAIPLSTAFFYLLVVTGDNQHPFTTAAFFTFFVNLAIGCIAGAWYLQNDMEEKTGGAGVAAAFLTAAVATALVGIATDVATGVALIASVWYSGEAPRFFRMAWMSGVFGFVTLLLAVLAVVLSKMKPYGRAVLLLLVTGVSSAGTMVYLSFPDVLTKLYRSPSAAELETLAFPVCGMLLIFIFWNRARKKLGTDWY